MTVLRAWQRICRSAPRKTVPGNSGNVLGGKSSQKTVADQIEIPPFYRFLIGITLYMSCRVWAFTREYRAFIVWQSWIVGKIRFPRSQICHLVERLPMRLER